MALFTDGTIATLADLKDYESSILDLASTENIDLTAKLNVAQRELALEIKAFLLRRGVQLPGRQLDSVVVNEELMHVHTNCALALTYRDACNSQLNDRYQSKWKQYTDISQRSIRQLFEIGIGINRSPIHKADLPILTSAGSGSNVAMTLYVKVAGIGSYGTIGACSDVSRLSVLPASGVQVRTPRLPAGAVGFVIFASDSEDSLTLQTPTPIEADALWIMPDTGLRKDLPTPPRQQADFYVANTQQILRG